MFDFLSSYPAASKSESDLNHETDCHEILGLM